ncbi:hypothetical protein [Burkholderia gladioli]|uniref:hypothetical protein n=1 Tax=Burkholderia gladioli TaxID=28095 RepID=UPI00163FD7F2|nr:hypothetical protein [Burkholderia gladioli]
MPYITLRAVQIHRRGGQVINIASGVPLPADIARGAVEVLVAMRAVEKVPAAERSAASATSAEAPTAESDPEPATAESATFPASAKR